MKQILGKTFVLLLILLNFANAAIVNVTVNNTNINIGDSVVLRLEAQGSDIEFPNIDSISNYKITNRSLFNSTSLSISNGMPNLTTTKVYELTFFPQASLTIPSFDIIIDSKKYKTTPIHITVNKSNISQNIHGNSDISLEMKSSKDLVYQKEPFVVSVFVSKKIGLDIESFDFTKPKFNGFYAKQIGSEKTTVHGEYEVTEIDYQVVPQKSGNLIIEPAHADVVAVNLNSNDIFNNIFSSQLQHKNISSNPINITVKPILNGVDLVGDFNLTSKVNTTITKPNNPVIYTLSIKGKGYLEDFNGINFDNKSFIVYPQKPKITQNTNSSFVSAYSRDYMFVSDKNFTIPSVTLRVFDTKSNSLKTITLPSYKISIVGAKINQNEVVTPKDKSIDFSTKNISIFWIIISFIAGVTSALIAISFKNFRFKKEEKKIDNDILNILLPYVGTDLEVEEIVNQIYAQKNGDKSIKIDKKRLKELLKKYKT